MWHGLCQGSFGSQSDEGLRKSKKVRSPTLYMQDESNRDNAQSIRDGTTSIASSRKSSAYRAVEEAEPARTAMLQAETEAMQSPVKGSLRATNQQHTVQSAKVDAMGYRIEEMKDLFL